MSIDRSDGEEPFAEEDAEEAGPESPNAANPASGRRIRDRVKRERAEAAAVWNALFATPAGRREAWGLLDAAGTFQKRFGTGPNGFPQPEASQFFDGRRSYGVDVWLGWLETCPDGVIQMLKEHHPRLKAEPRHKRKRRPRTQAEQFAQEDRDA